MQRERERDLGQKRKRKGLREFLPYHGQHLLPLHAVPQCRRSRGDGHRRESRSRKNKRKRERKEEHRPEKRRRRRRSRARAIRVDVHSIDSFFFSFFISGAGKGQTEREEDREKDGEKKNRKRQSLQLSHPSHPPHTDLDLSTSVYSAAFKSAEIQEEQKSRKTTEGEAERIWIERDTKRSQRERENDSDVLLWGPSSQRLHLDADPETFACTGREQWRVEREEDATDRLTQREERTRDGKEIQRDGTKSS